MYHNFRSSPYSLCRNFTVVVRVLIPCTVILVLVLISYTLIFVRVLIPYTVILVRVLILNMGGGASGFESPSFEVSETESLY